MTCYYDTGVLLKLYTLEPASEAVRSFVVRRKTALPFSMLHRTECVSALRLKCFRGECDEAAASRAILDIEADVSAGVLSPQGIDWDEAWNRCRALSDAYGAATGCRTLDALHVACAQLLTSSAFVTTDERQGRLARKAGLRVIDPRKG